MGSGGFRISYDLFDRLEFRGRSYGLRAAGSGALVLERGISLTTTLTEVIANESHAQRTEANNKT